jgi:hypothetical protein
MLQTKLIQLLSTLTVDEYRRFKKMLKSPFFTTSPHFLKLYEVLKKYHPLFENQKLTKEYVYNRVFARNKYDENKMRMLMRDFTSLVEDYLIWIDLKSQKQERAKRMLSVYLKRDLFVWYERDRKRLLKELEKQPYRDLEYYNELYHLDFDYFFHPLTSKRDLHDDILQRLMDSIDRQFILAKYRIMSEMKNRERIKTKNYELRFLQLINSKEVNEFLHENVFYQLYTLLFQLPNEENIEPFFQKLKLFFIAHIDKIRRVDQSLFLGQLINLGVREINNGNSIYYSEVLDLYKVGLENDLIIERQQMTVATFGNIVTVGCHAEDFEWVETFIETHQLFLDAKVRETTVAINLGLWHFYQNNFDAAYDLFLQHSFAGAYQPKARFYLIRTLFEQFLLDESLYDFLMAQIEAFEKLLYRNHLLAAYHQEVFLNSVQLLKKLVHLILKREKPHQARTIFTKELNQKKNIVAKTWFLKKIDAILQ